MTIEQISTVVTDTKFWQRTLGEQKKDKYASQRTALREAFRRARVNAAQLAAEIPRYLPEFTDHSIEHIDSLWGLADKIIGDEYPVTPAEAFVFGCAALLHDCAMSLAAYPGRMEDIKADPRWRDLLAIRYRDRDGKAPDAATLDTPEETIRNAALGDYLRENHAKQAERLATQFWTDRSGQQQFIIADPEVRTHYGELIGKVAHSHHWSLERLLEEMRPATLGPMLDQPDDWHIDAIKVACLLRTADACHLDHRRAPGFVRAFRDLPVESAKHWDFQHRLARPVIRDDALEFNTRQAFKPEDTESWWLAHDMLTAAHKELSGADALLADRGTHRFRVRRIRNIGTPTMLTDSLHADGWKPVDARFHVGDVGRIISTLGGEALYGSQDPFRVVLRELIQNAMDAVRVRRSLERRGDNWGRVIVSFESRSDGNWLVVSDDGT